MPSNRSLVLAALASAILSVEMRAQAEPLVGPSVGSADALLSEGNRLYNRKSYAKAANQYLKATRANPTAIQAYLALARSYMGAKQVQNACLAYRAYLKAAPESAERSKAQGELELCERRLKSTKKKRADPSPEYAELKALFAGAMEQKHYVGVGSAGEALKSLVHSGYVGTDLADMAAKLNAAAAQAADDIYKRVLAHERVPAEELTKGRRLYQLAVDVGPAPPSYGPHMAFLEGLALLQQSEPKKAEIRFAEASLGEPSVLEYKFYRAIAMYRSGNKSGAMEALEADLPQDSRTAVLRTALALGNSPDAAAAELEQVLFQKRFPGSAPRRP